MNVSRYQRPFFGLMIFTAISVAPLAWPYAEAAESKPTKFWNLTGETIVKFELGPAGKDNFGADQCENDKDHAVDDDERLPVTGIASGSYDARITFKNGGVCLAKSIAVEEGKVFSIDGKQLTDCHEPK
jgi:hypothetical protein